MSGNPHGLSELNHFGSMQRVGGKAAGFINKKFFHPSSLRNQEKLWQAQTADERNQRKQKEMQQRREEELQVENLRKQMYLAGQGKASDLKSSSISTADAPQDGSSKGERWEAAEEQKRRKLLLKQATDAEARRDQEDGDNALEGISGERKFAKSKYTEDEFVNGHTTVWGSWYATAEKQWGFACCKTLDRTGECPLEPEELAEDENAKSSGQGKRRRKGNDGGLSRANETMDEGRMAADVADTAREGKPSTPLLDPKFVEASQKRKERKRLEDEEKRKAKDKESSYLGDLLQDASSKTDSAPGIEAATAEDGH